MINSAHTAASQKIANRFGFPCQIYRTDGERTPTRGIIGIEVQSAGFDGNALPRFTTISLPTAAALTYGRGDLIEFDSGQKFEITSTVSQAGDDQSMRIFAVKDINCGC